MRIFDKNNKKAMSEWDKINQAITGSNGKRKLTTKDVRRIEEVAPTHDSAFFSDEVIIAENRGKQHWKVLGEYVPTCSYMPTWSINDPGDKKSLYYPYIPDDDLLMEEIYRDRKEARNIVKEHKKTMGHEINEDAKTRFNRRNGF